MVSAIDQFLERATKQELTKFIQLLKERNDKGKFDNIINAIQRTL